MDIEKRKSILLKAALDLLKSCNEGPYVKDVLCETAIWDGVECDGHCLMEEIQEILELEG